MLLRISVLLIKIDPAFFIFNHRLDALCRVVQKSDGWNEAARKIKISETNPTVEPIF